MSELDDLKKENKELKAKILELEFISKLNRALADKRADIIEKLLKSQNDFLKKISNFEQNAIFKKMIDRIMSDNEKYDKLKTYLLNTFPKVLKIKNYESKIEESKGLEKNEDDLSESYIDENGNIYAPMHIIDVTINLIELLKKQIEDMIGKDYNNNDDGDDDLY